jgi:excisionase family DNA binding protein
VTVWSSRQGLSQGFCSYSPKREHIEVVDWCSPQGVSILPVVAPDVEDDAFGRIRDQYPPIVTTAQVAELLDINPRTVLMMAADGRLPASRLPGSRKFHFFLEDVLKALRQHMVKPGETTLTEADIAEAEDVDAVAPVKKKAAATRTRRPTAKGGRASG